MHVSEVPQGDGVDKRLSAAIRIPTVSHSEAALDDRTLFVQFQAFLREAYPRVHDALQCEILNEYAILYTWPGMRPELDPILLLAHYDVVPAEPSGWRHPPFSGAISDGQIWGRGAVDYKVGIIGMLEACEELLKAGFAPQRTIQLAFGGDEEVNGPKGAAKLAGLLRERGRRFEFILDEGGVVSEGIVRDIKGQLALIGVAEKGHVNVVLSASTTGGHASMPPAHTAAGLIARAAARIESHPFPPRLTPTVRRFFESLAPFVSPVKRLIFQHLGLFGPLHIRVLARRSATTAAMVRTTLALTQLAGSDKENVLPDKASALFNIRILPGETIATTIARLQKIVADPAVQIELQESWVNNDPIESADINTASYRALEATIRQFFPTAVIAPYLMSASTDSKHYADLADNIYRFLPIPLNPVSQAAIHGVDEHLAVADLERAVSFYAALIACTTREDT